jgi:hypothetical protein
VEFLLDIAFVANGLANFRPEQFGKTLAHSVHAILIAPSVRPNDKASSA